MEFSALFLVVINFIVIGLLPKIFFKQGRLTLMWLLTAWPYMACPIISCMMYTGWLPFFDYASAEYLSAISAIVVPLSVFSIAMIFMTVGTHRIPLALWHQKHTDDAPKQIVTWGTYKYIRHPFYSSFILAALTNVLLAPGWLNVAMFVYIFYILNFTASKEERRLASDENFGDEYRSYLRSTHRFIPRLF
jgi:protein-S-isoprenylcysteine O-methyltransferase Ste14